MKFRWRLLYSRGEELKFLSHLDMMRLWERALRRAGIPLVYSQGFSPHPRISIAAPLPVGVTSEAELMDIYLRRPLSPEGCREGIASQLPQGVELRGLWVVSADAPSLQSQVRFAFYLVSGEIPGENIEERISKLLSQEHLPWEHPKNGGVKRYDLRPLIADLRVVSREGDRFTLEMKLCCDSFRGSARPDQVARALGFSPLSIHRTKLVLGEP